MGVFEKIKKYRYRKGLNTIEKALTILPAVRRVLDVGCGRGDDLNLLCSSRNLEYVGIDIYNYLSPGRRFDFLIADARYLPFRNFVFDFALMSHVIEHMPKEDGAKAVQSIHRVLKDGALFYNDTVNRSNPSKKVGGLLRSLGFNLHQGRKNELLAKALRERPKSLIHQYEYTHKELMNQMKTSFNIVKVGGITFEWYPFTRLLKILNKILPWSVIQKLICEVDEKLESLGLWWLKSTIYVIGQK